MYLLPPGQTIRNRKLGLYPPVRLRRGLDGLGAGHPNPGNIGTRISASAARDAAARAAVQREVVSATGVPRGRRGRLRLSGLGDDVPIDIAPVDSTLVDPNQTPPPLLLPSGQLVDQVTLSTGQNVPVPFTIPPKGPLTGAALDSYNKMVAGTVPPQSPLDYVSPQAAIAAGQDPGTVYAAWTANVNKFPSVQAAIAAGVPPGVVTQLWQGGPASQPAPTSWFSGSTFGIPNAVLAGGVGLLVFLGGMGGGGRRRR